MRFRVLGLLSGFENGGLVGKFFSFVFLKIKPQTFENALKWWGLNTGIGNAMYSNLFTYFIHANKQIVLYNFLIYN